MKLVLPHFVTTRVALAAFTLLWLFYVLLAARSAVEGIIRGMNASVLLR